MPVLTLSPALTPPNYLATEGQLLVINLSATDPDGAALTFTIGNKPTGADFVDNHDGTAQFTWTPSFTQAGTYPNVLFTHRCSRFSSLNFSGIGNIF
jgi:hypothetical protein